MFPSNGTTVWVNFKDKPYLGKVLQTSPELDMVCVRISDHVDRVSREEEDCDTFSHSCPESNRSIFSNCQSSVVITCGLNDVCPLNSKILGDFKQIQPKGDSEKHKKDVKPHEKNLNSVECDNIPTHENNNLSQYNDNGEEDDEEEEFSNSFGINNILRNSRENKRISKIWKCRLCHIYLNDEVDMKNHVFTEHKLATQVESDNWIVIEGITGCDYEEVKYEEDSNIRSLNNIHLSNNSNRKRQFNESMTLEYGDQQILDDHRNCLHGESLDVSMKSELENSLSERKFSDISFPILNHIIQETRALVTEIDRLSTTSPYYNSSTNLNELTAQNDECVDLNHRNNLFHYFLTSNSLRAPISFSLTNSLPNSTWPERFRPHSLSDNYSVESLLNEAGSMDQKPMFSSPKRTRIDSNIKKCRKIYGIDQRHLWCNQCKWKKACSRFCNDVNSSL